MPSAIKQYVQGTWSLGGGNEPGRTGKLSVNGTTFWNVGAILRVRGAEVGDKVVVVFDLSERRLHVRIGNEELAEAMSEGVDIFSDATSTSALDG